LSIDGYHRSKNFLSCSMNTSANILNDVTNILKNKIQKGYIFIKSKYILFKF
jgi:hypothetical protein